jgi:hypothetical protein
VAELAGFGHAEELEAVESLVFAAEQGAHHLGGFGLGVGGLVANRGVLAVKPVDELVRAA